MRFRPSVVLALMLALLTPHGAVGQGSAPAFQPREESPEEFPAHPNRDDAFYGCTACHNFKLVAAQGLSRAQWDETIDLMVKRHKMPEPDAKERQAMLDYLETAFPPRAPAGRGWQNPFLRR